MTYVHILKVYASRRLATHALLGLQIGRDTKMSAKNSTVTVDGCTVIRYECIESPVDIERLRGHRWDVVDIDHDSYHRSGKLDLLGQIIASMAYMVK